MRHKVDLVHLNVLASRVAEALSAARPALDWYASGDVEAGYPTPRGVRKALRDLRNAVKSYECVKAKSAQPLRRGEAQQGFPMRALGAGLKEIRGRLQKAGYAGQVSHMIAPKTKLPKP